MIRNRITVALSLLLILTGCATTKPEPLTTLSQYQEQELNWRECYQNYECAYLQVPIDYADLETGSFSLSLLRFKALDQEQRIGSLVVNPGGPGSSGINYAYNAEYIVSPEILKQFDIVGFDPRGVGESAPIRCLTDSETDASFAADPKPDNAAELALLISDTSDFFAKCAERSNGIMHYGTLDSAHDMDILRSALGDNKLNFLGKSYGTYLGTLYAKLFPATVGRFVLDGAVDPYSSNREAVLGQAIGFDLALDAFISDCLKRTDCSLSGKLADALTQVVKLFKDTSQKPLQSDSGRQVTEGLVVVGIASALYDSSSGWPVLREAFTESALGNGDTFLKLADQYAGREKDGKYLSNENDALQVIDCLDHPEVSSLAKIKEGAIEFARKAPVFGPYLAYSEIICRYFPNLNKVTQIKIEKLQTGPILIIGTTRDPATPYKWAQSLNKLFQSSVLITFDGDGHTGHGRGSTCVDSAVDRYLLTGVTSKSDLFCAK
jgi:pimeloyl-ACP methyl ester carboxylesterase